MGREPNTDRERARGRAGPGRAETEPGRKLAQNPDARAKGGDTQASGTPCSDRHLQAGQNQENALASGTRQSAVPRGSAYLRAAHKDYRYTLQGGNPPCLLFSFKWRWDMNKFLGMAN